MLKEANQIAPGDQWIEGRHHVEAIECKPHPTFATVVNITVKYVDANRRETISFYRVNKREIVDSNNMECLDPNDTAGQ